TEKTFGFSKAKEHFNDSLPLRVLRRCEDEATARTVAKLYDGDAREIASDRAMPAGHQRDQCRGPDPSGKSLRGGECRRAACARARDRGGSTRSGRERGG